jgi:hypothetical protein
MLLVPGKDFVAKSITHWAASVPTCFHFSQL